MIKAPSPNEPPIPRPALTILGNTKIPFALADNSFAAGAFLYNSSNATFISASISAFDAEKLA